LNRFGANWSSQTFSKPFSFQIIKEKRKTIFLSRTGRPSESNRPDAVFGLRVRMGEKASQPGLGYGPKPFGPRGQEGGVVTMVIMAPRPRGQQADGHCWP
jgi:hypothetical protein